MASDELLGLADPQRTCVGCRLRESRNVLLRVVVHDASLVVDRSAVLPGRGAWLHRDLQCLEAAVRRRAFTRALRVSGALDTEGLRVEIDQLVHQPESTGR